MNEKIQIIFGLLGGLAVFIYGMNMMSECLQKAAGEKNEKHSCTSDKESIARSTCRSCYDCSTAEQQCNNGDGNRICECRTDEPAAGNFDYFWCKYRNYDDGTDHCILRSVTIFTLSLFIGFIIAFVTKSAKIKSIGQTIFAFGLLFLGIETMGDVMETTGFQSGLYRPDRKSRTYSGFRCRGWDTDDSGGTEQQCNHRSPSEFCCTARGRTE